ncbi:MAG: hypothetical protein CR993_03885 [Rhodobacterales bacterium]|nr:MAG: hypothetical protein CR993_03885 [Rhodobacterales bacterium]
MAGASVSEARFRVGDGAEFVRFVAAMMAQLEYGCEPRGDGLDITSPFGVMRLRLEGDAVLLRVSAEGEGNLVLMRESAAYFLGQFRSDLANVTWSGAHRAGALPVNFRLGRVQSVEERGASYLRMTLAGEGFARFASGGLHFRLLRQKHRTGAPQWPRMNARGTTDWPEGAAALVDKVYTIRALDVETGTLVFDIFRHPGGFTSEWAETRPIGEVVGIMGPGGGWLIEREWALIGGDETALPAIARQLAAAKPGQGGKVFVLVGSEADVEDLPSGGDYEVTWLFRDRGDDLVAAMTGTEVDFGADYGVWFAASKDQAAAVRDYFRARAGFDRKRLQSVAYWF